MYPVGFAVIYLLLNYRSRKGEGWQIFNKNQKFEIRNPKQIQNIRYKLQDPIFDFLLFAFLGVLIGGRLGYVLFYNFSYFLENPLAVISPFSQITGEFIGIYGMSYHGGLLGVLMTGWFFCWKRKIKLIDFADFIVPAIPAGYFFGRIGNFLNGELYGRATNVWFGMYFPEDAFKILRHPSQLYEAFFEGVILFLIFWIVRNRKSFQEKLLALYFLGYALARFLGEFFREPDEQIGLLFGNLTLGQLFSLGMFAVGLLLLFYKKTNYAIIKKC